MTETPANSIGACGDDCSFCPRYLATISNDPKALRRIRDLWVSFGWRTADVDIQSLRCTGCNKENKCAYPELRNCAFGKGHGNCGRCKDYPCDLVNAAFLRTEEALSHPDLSICTPEERALLFKAFSRKKSNLDAIHGGRFNLETRDAS